MTAFPDDEPFETDPEEVRERKSRRAVACGKGAENGAPVLSPGEHEVSTQSPRARHGPSLKMRAIDFLSRREHSRLELSRKLQRHCEDLNVIEKVLDELEHAKWLSDDRYANSLVNRRAHKFGRRRVIQELRQNGITSERIHQIATELTSTEFPRALEVWERKFGQLPADQKAYAKQFRFMASRGFSSDIFQKIISDAKQRFQLEGSPDSYDPEFD